jgi:hypothetical protein
VSTIAQDEIHVALPFSSGWNRIPGITVDGEQICIDPERYFFRYDNPSWWVCDWDLVREKLLGAGETTEHALEQQVVEFVRQHGRHTSDPAQVLTTAWKVYDYIFREAHLDDPGLAWVTPKMLTMLKETATLMALNRVELDGRIANVGPAWMVAAAAQVAFDLSDEQAQDIDELYHGLWFNEVRRIESVRAHAALGGRLVHGCQSRPNMSGGCVVPFGTDIDGFYRELAAMRASWLDMVRACRIT